MSHSAFGTNGMAFTNNSRSFTNLGTPTTSENKSHGNTLKSSYNLARGGWASPSTWNGGSLTHGFNSRDATRDNSRSGSTRHNSSDEEVIEGKTGSGSLVESSVSDDWTYLPQGPKRSLPTGRSMSQAQNPEASAFQQRSASNAGLPSSFTSVTQNQNALTFASRPTPTISLNSTSSAQSRSGLAAPYSFGFSSRGGEPPPAVYTKFNRPSDPNAAKPDSAKDFWADYSPTDERKPLNVTFGSRTMSTPASRDGSLPSSHHGDEQLFFPKADYPNVSQRPTQNNSRAPSISSPGNGIYHSFANPNSDQLVSRLNQLTMNNNGRPPTSHKGSIGSTAMFNFQSPLSTTSAISRSAIAGSGFVGDAEELDRVGVSYLDTDGYASPQQSAIYPDYSVQGFGSRHLPTPSLSELRQAEPYPNGARGPFAFELPSAARPSRNWAIMPENSAPANRRAATLQEQNPYVDFQMHNQMLNPQPRNPYAHVYSPYTMQQALQINDSSPFMPFIPMNLPPIEANRDYRDVNPHSGECVQSSLMYEFKSNAKSKRYELKDIYDHIAEFSGDQHGSRFIQTKLETANSDEKERVFLEIEPNAIQLMTDVFGNYVIQKFFEHGDQKHKKILASKMKGEVLNLSLQMYGCRVVQKALDHVLVDQQHELVSELEGQVLKCVKDQNGNHVIQKAIERCRPATIGFIIRAFHGDVQHLSIHPYGCRVIQRCLERCEPDSKGMIMHELMGCLETLISDQYGNYVVQHVVQHDESEGKQMVLNMVERGLEAYSKHKFASNVVEKCLERSDDFWRRRVMCALAGGHPQRGEGEGVFVSMIKDSYGNYVIQKLLDTLNPDDYVHFIDLLQPALNQAKRTGCGKQVVSIEKKMHRIPHFRGGPNGVAYNPHSYRLPLPLSYANNIDSAANTPPPLTADTQSLQSSAIQSLNGDAVEGAAIRSRNGSEQSAEGYFR